MTRANSPLDFEEAQTQGLTLADVFRVTRKHRKAIFLSLAAFAAAYVIGAAVLLLAVPAEHVTSLDFTLEFRGADRGEYPNGTKFSSTEIISTPVLARVYRMNDLSRYVSFDKFRNSVFIIQSNDSLDVLTRQYRAKLADPKLSAVDRERIEKEFEEKKSVLSKAEHSLSLAARHRFAGIPMTLRRKVLLDILAVWAEVTAKDKGVALYDLAILSSGIFEREQLASYDYIVALDLIRSRMNRVIANIDELSRLPGAKVLRTRGSGRSLAELRVRIDDARDFRLRPVLGMVLAKGISKDPAVATEFLRTQLKFNELETQEAVERVNTVRDAIATYARRSVTPQETSSAPLSGTTVIPQIDESFLNRIAELSGEASDLQYRQELIDDLRSAALNVVPLQAEARYYQSMLESFSTTLRLPTPEEKTTINTQVDGIVSGAIRDTADVFEVYEALSKDLNPSTILYSVTTPARASIERSVSPLTLLIGGLLLLFIAAPLSIVGVVMYELSRKGQEPDEPSAADRRPDGVPGPSRATAALDSMP
ncbi:MAG: hypothetical protein ACXW5U_03970 [Thermoanaerobaculia bacterium]